jgi:dTDP-4-amino-4,6-dideoxygalactose transaminase
VPPGSVTSGWPRHEDDEIDAVVKVLHSGRVNALVHGEETRSFASEFADYIGMPHAICVANGTVSLEVGLRVLGIGPGDEVIVPARSFFASASCILAIGATPVFADVHADSQNIDPASAERMISPRTKAVICVHLAGWPCDMAALMAVCDRHGLFLVEDCAQAHGAAIHGRRVGSYGDISSFSFCTDKIMSTGGEGGILLLRDEERWAQAWAYKDHGKNPHKVASSAGAPGEFRYLHDGPGTNFRLTEMQAAIGRRQLRKLPQWLDARKRNAALLHQHWQSHPLLSLPGPPDHVDHAWYKYYVQLADADGRSRIIARLQEQGIPCGSGSCPDISREGAFAGQSVTRDGDLPVARALGERTLMFPVDHTLGAEDMQRIGGALLKVLDE